MTQKVKQETALNFQMKAIELLKGSINAPADPQISLTNFNFNINVESKANASEKLVFVIVSVDIRSEDQNHILGSLSVSCIYHIVNFDEFIITNEGGQLNIPPVIVEILNSISISTTRGVMFSTFKGTFLHNALLPVLDPKAFQQSI